MSKKKKKKRKGNKHYPWFEPTPPNPYSKKLKLISTITVGESECHCEPDARTFTFFRLRGSVYVLADQFVFKYEPSAKPKYLYMEEMFESALEESIFNKGGMYADWMISSWGDLERMNDLGIKALEEAVWAVPWDDDEKMEHYYQSEDYLFVEDFTTALVDMERDDQEMFLSLLELKGLVEEEEVKLRSLISEEDICPEDLDYYMPPEGGIYIDGVYYNETERQWMDYWMANGNWEAVWRLQGLIDDTEEKPKKRKKKNKKKGKNNRPKHPSDVFSHHSEQEKLKIHETAHQLYKDRRKDSAGKLSGKAIGKIAAELVDVSGKNGLSITSEQSMKYFQQNIKNLEKSYKKSVKAN